MPLWLLRMLARVRADLVVFVPTDDPVVALAIAGGPDVAVLETLARHDARATFFLLGEEAAQQPTLVRRIAEEGHELGNATWDGTPSVDGVARTQGVLEPVAPPRFLWAGAWPSRSVRDAAERHGLRCAAGARRPRRGAVIELREPTPSAVESLLTDLRERGLRPTTLADLAARA